MPIMAPLADLVGVTRQVAVLAFQMGAGFVDAFTPVSASLIGVLGVARIDWGKWAKFQIKMQAFFFLMGTVAIAIAIAVKPAVKLVILSRYLKRDVLQPCLNTRFDFPTILK